MKKLLFLFLSLPFICIAQKVDKAGCGEYGIYLLSGGKVFTNYWTSYNQMTAVNTGGKKIIDVSGNLYNGAAIDSDGYLYTFFHGNLTPAKITSDTLGKPFSGNIQVQAWFYTTYVTLKSDGTIWLLGGDAWQLFSNGSLITGKPIQVPTPLGVKFTKIVAADHLIGLSNTGDVYDFWGKAATKIKLPGAASDVTGSYNQFYLAVVNGQPYGWGQKMQYLGQNAPISTPILLPWSIQTPIVKVSCNDNALHYIDANGGLWGIGDNAIGNVGNGQELVNKADIYPSPYAWSWWSPNLWVS